MTATYPFVEMTPRENAYKSPWIYGFEHPNAVYYNAAMISEWQVIRAWCRDQFGPAATTKDRNEDRAWYFDGHVVAFRNVCDAIAFKLRWV